MAEKMFQWTVSWLDKALVLQRKTFDDQSAALKFADDLDKEGRRASVIKNLHPDRDRDPAYRKL